MKKQIEKIIRQCHKHWSSDPDTLRHPVFMVKSEGSFSVGYAVRVEFDYIKNTYLVYGLTEEIHDELRSQARVSLVETLETFASNNLAQTIRGYNFRYRAGRFQWTISANVNEEDLPPNETVSIEFK